MNPSWLHRGITSRLETNCWSYGMWCRTMGANIHARCPIHWALNELTVTSAFCRRRLVWWDKTNRMQRWPWALSSLQWSAALSSPLWYGSASSTRPGRRVKNTVWQIQVGGTYHFIFEWSINTFKHYLLHVKCNLTVVHDPVSRTILLPIY